MCQPQSEVERQGKANKSITPRTTPLKTNAALGGIGTHNTLLLR